MAKTRSANEEYLKELVRNADGTILDPVGFEPSEKIRDRDAVSQQNDERAQVST